jgi:hypothetical protein
MLYSLMEGLLWSSGSPLTCQLTLQQCFPDEELSAIWKLALGEEGEEALFNNNFHLLVSYYV